MTGGAENSARAGAARKARADQLPSQVVVGEERARDRKPMASEKPTGRAAVIVGAGFDGGVTPQHWLLCHMGLY